MQLFDIGKPWGLSRSVRASVLAASSASSGDKRLLIEQVERLRPASSGGRPCVKPR
jgi:hypothetical protein